MSVGCSATAAAPNENEARTHCNLMGTGQSGVLQAARSNPSVSGGGGGGGSLISLVGFAGSRKLHQSPAELQGTLMTSVL